MLYSFRRRGFTFAGITLLQLYVKAPVSSMIDLNLSFPTVMSFIVKRMGFSCSKQLIQFATGLILLCFPELLKLRRKQRS